MSEMMTRAAEVERMAESIGQMRMMLAKTVHRDARGKAIDFPRPEHEQESRWSNPSTAIYGAGSTFAIVDTFASALRSLHVLVLCPRQSDAADLAKEIRESIGHVPLYRALFASEMNDSLFRIRGGIAIGSIVVVGSTSAANFRGAAYDKLVVFNQYACVRDALEMAKSRLAISPYRFETYTNGLVPVFARAAGGRSVVKEFSCRGNCG